MPVQCQQVSEVLRIRGLDSPELEVLAPTEQSFRALLLQPSGPIFADAQRIGHFNVAEAEIRCRKFLALASERGNHLVVVPEYCLPVSVLLACAQDGPFPAPSALWVLGCESITPAQLEEFNLAVAGYCDVIAEDDSAAPVQGTYYDAIAYCFQSRDSTGDYKRVILFQFKTCPSRDPHFFENQHLRVGRTIYQFRGQGGHLGLSTIICSDAFTIGQDAQLCAQLTDRTTLIHIQLNPDPRHADYREYRRATFARGLAFSNCDIVCLNWSRNVTQHDTPEDVGAAWNNIGGSAWYLPVNRCSTNDHEVRNNDSRGLYYSLLDRRRHVLLFHYDEAAFELRVPKVGHFGPGVLDNIQGPQVDGRYTWDPRDVSWKLDLDGPEPGLDELLSSDQGVATAFATLKATNNRLSIERAVALSCGPQNISETWHKVDQLESCQMKSDEIVQRITFCMDTCVEAKTLRHDRVQRVAALNYILANDELPPQIRDLAGGGATVTWNADSPNTNITKDGRMPALIAYIGNQPLPERQRNLADAAVELLRRENGAHQRRVAVCYRKTDNTTAFVPMPALTRIDYDDSSLSAITGAMG